MEKNEIAFAVSLGQIILFGMAIYMLMQIRNDLAELKKVQYENGGMIYDTYNNTQAIRNYFLQEPN